MNYVVFDGNSINHEDFFQYGNGRYFEGFEFQRGFGIGDMFKEKLRTLLKKAGKRAGQEALETGARILHDIAEGKNVKDSILTEAEQGLKNITKPRRKKCDQEVDGRRRKRKAPAKKKKKKRVIRKKISLVGRSVNKKARRADTLGFL